MKDRNKLIIAVVAVLAIIIAVVGATYAYWRWASSDTEKTTVNFTVDAGLSASLDGGTLTVSKLAPVDSCLNTTYATKAPVTLNYSNNSGVTAKALGTLTVTTFTVATGRDAFKTGDLGHLHYALTSNGSSCSSNVIASGTFDGKGSSGSVLINGVTLADNIASGTTNGSKPMYLYIWLDNSYEFTNIGSGVVKDPMEDLTIKLTWSGQITNTQPGS